MKTVVIDTNALLSFVTDRAPAQQEVVSEVFEQAACTRCRILCHQHVLSEFVYVLEKVYGHSKASIHDMISDFLAMPGIEIRHEIDFHVLLNLWPNSIADFGDAVIATLWTAAPKATIVTFDKKFRKELTKIGANVHRP